MNGKLRQSDPGIDAKAGLAPGFCAGAALRLGLVGVGGAGCATLATIARGLGRPAAAIAINTDAGGLERSQAQHRILIGAAAADLGSVQQAAARQWPEILARLQGLDLVFVVAGLGGIAGTAIAPIVAELAGQAEARCCAVAFTPFEFEGRERQRLARQGLAELGQHADALLELSGKTLSRGHEQLTFAELFERSGAMAARLCQAFAASVAADTLAAATAAAAWPPR